MRPILAFAMLLLGLSSAAPEAEYSALLAYPFHLALGTPVPSMVEIESSTGKTDRQFFALPPAEPSASAKPSASTEPGEQATGREAVETLQASVSATVDPVPDQPKTADQSPTSDQTAAFDSGETFDQTTALTDAKGVVSIDGLCNALLISAQDNDLPVPFFANLLWQESGLRNDVVSSKGAVGIAQFMPETAEEEGLSDPRDPLQAIQASARLLNELRQQFGNLGFAAAAYNAGPHRVADWLQRHRTLPRETRGYVMNITGRTIEQWKATPPDDSALRFVRRLPCRDLPAFAELEQEQADQAQADGQNAPAEEVADAAPAKPLHVASRWRLRRYFRHATIPTAYHSFRGRYAAERLQRLARDRRRSV